MSNLEPDWEAVVTAALRVAFPLLPATLPDEVATLIPVWAERASGMDPSVRQEQLGSYMAIYATQGLPITELEFLILKPYRRPRSGSAVLPSNSSEASDERGEDWWI